jgi:DNA-binding MarR family transcriptional regulator
MCVVMSDSDDSAPVTEIASESEAAVAAVVSATDWRLSVWRSFLRTHTHLLRRLEQQLQAHGKIALGSYDVLVQLAEAPEGRLRMSELAEAVLLSRSGLTRLVDRLQKDGLVERRPDPEDARGMYTVLTARGRDALRDASVVHLAGVSELVLTRLSEAELRQLQALMVKLDPAGPRDVAGLSG